MPEFYRTTFTFEGKRYYCKGKTKKEADQKAALRKRDLEEARIDPSRITVNEWWKEYVETYKTRANDSTLSDYKGIYKNAIAPYIGALPLKSVRSADLQRILNNLPGKSFSYLHKAKNLLSGMFRTAADNDLIIKSPYRGLKDPAFIRGERRCLTPEERKTFLAAANNLGREGLFFLIIYYCGLRPSEVPRIEGGDIRGGVLMVRGTKTTNAARRVPVPDALKIPACSGPLFLNQRRMRPGKTAWQGWWKHVRAEMERISGKPVAEDLTPDCLRHDYCTRLQEIGVPIDIARRLMGHSSVEVTARIYTHTTDTTIETARSMINRALPS